MQNLNINSFIFNKTPSIQQQQHLFQAQHFQQSQEHHIESSVIDYSLNRTNNLSCFNQASALNLSQQTNFQYQQKKLNYKSKINKNPELSDHKIASLSFNKKDNHLNDDSNTNNEEKDDDDYEDNDLSHNLDSSFSNFSYSAEPSSDLFAKNGKTSKSALVSNRIHNIKQEKEETNEFGKKRRESYANDNNYDNDDDDDDNHHSEMNDDDDDGTMNDSKEKRQKSDLNCVVCDSPANGYNFDAVTCESCKAFFRRNAFRPINLFRCSNNDACVITVATRKKCKKCRIAKCFRLGMRRDWIMTEVEREEKRKKIEENRRRKQTTPSSNITVDSDMMMHAPASNCSNHYDDYSNQQDNSSLPVRRRRRRRRNSWFDLNNKKPPQQQQQQPQTSQSQTHQQQPQMLMNNKTVLSTNDLQQSSTSGTVSTEKQNSPLSSSLSSTSSSSSSSSFTNNNRQSQFETGASGLIQNNEINENHQKPFALNHHSSNLLPLNLITKQNLDNAQNSLTNKLTSINQYIIDNNKNPISTPFVLSPTVQQQLQLTFEQQQRQMLLNSNFKNSMPLLDFHSHSSPLSNSQDSLFKQQYAAIAASSSQMHINSPHSSAFNLASISSNSLPSAENNDATNASLNDDKKCIDPRRRRRLKEPNNSDNNEETINKLPVTHHSDVSQVKDVDNIINPPALAVNTLLPSLKYLSKSNINNFNEIKLNTNAIKNDSNYLSFSETTELVRSPRVLSPVSSTSSSSSSSSSCDQFQYNNNNLNENLPIKMNDLQRKQVEAIQQAYKQAIQLVKAQGLPKNSQDINTTINLTELAVRRVIFYFKLISDFRELKHDLMVVLLKFNMMSLLQIHGINSYNKEENTFKEPDTDDTPFSAQSIENVYGTSVYELSISITRNLFDLCAGDMTHIKILMLIVLFDPYNEKLNEQEKTTVAKLQNKYVTLLHAYLCELMGSPRAEHTFKAVLIEISKINDLGKWFEKTVAEKSSCDFVRPLMKEVFGIATPANSAASTPVASSHPSSIDSSCSTKSNKQINDGIECINNDSNYETPTTCSTSLSDSSFYNNNNNLKFSSSSPNNK